MKTRLNIWPFGTNQPLGRRVSYGKRRISELSRSSKRPVSAKAAAKAERERESERKERVVSDPNLERKLKAHYARGGTLNEFLAANPASYSAFFDSTSKGKARDYRGFKVWPVFGGWKTSLSALPTFGSEREVKQFIDTHLAKRNPAGTRGEFQRCVDAVSARSGAYDPRAVCASMERRKYGQKELTRRAKAGSAAKRGNPMSGKIAKKWADLGYSDGKTGDNADEDFRIRAHSVRFRTAADRAEAHRQYLINYEDARTGFRHRNPADAAAEVFEEFHGMPSTEIVEVTKRVHYHKNLAAVGRLEALVVMRPGGEHRLVGFKGAKLCTNECKNQLFVEGGDQALDSADFGYQEWQIGRAHV